MIQPCLGFQRSLAQVTFMDGLNRMPELMRGTSEVGLLSSQHEARLSFLQLRHHRTLSCQNTCV